MLKSKNFFFSWSHDPVNYHCHCFAIELKRNWMNCMNTRIVEWACVFLLKQAINHYNQHDTPMYAIFLDSSKAFDRVCHYILFQKLSKNQVLLNLVRFIMYWYKPGCRTVSNNGSGSGLAPAQNILAVRVWFAWTQFWGFRFTKMTRFIRVYGSGSGLVRHPGINTKWSLLNGIMSFHTVSP